MCVGGRGPKIWGTLWIDTSVDFFLIPSPLHVAQQCRAVASLSHPNEKLEAAHHRWQQSIPGISWKDKVTNGKVREAIALPKLEDIIRCRRLRWLGHLSQMDHHRLS